jgi:diguanylate cyclase (GGDEF)-like protein
VSQQIANAFKRAVEHDATAGRDVLGALPNIDHIGRLAHSHEGDAAIEDTDLSIVILDVDLIEVTSSFGRSAADEILRHVARIIKAKVRTPDVVFRYGASKFLVLLHSTTPTTVERVANDLALHVTSNRVVLRSGAALAVRLSTRFLSTPRDGRSLQELLASARLVDSSRTPEASKVH